MQHDRRRDAVRSTLDSESSLKTTVTNPRRPFPVDGGRDAKGTGDAAPVLAYLLALHPDDLRGRHYALRTEGPIRLGRHPQNDICVPSGDVSRRHCVFERRNGEWVVEDCASTNGTHVDDEPIETRVLAPGNRLTIGGPVMMFLAGEGMEAELLDALQSLNHRDGLTSLPNKADSVQALDQACLAANALGTPLSVALFRLDDLEHLQNDESIVERYRHSRVGVDRVIREVADVMAEHARPDDVFGKYDYGEFLWVMPETSAEQATELAERLRRTIEGHAFQARGKRIPITVSAGVVGYESDWDVAHVLDQTEAQLWTARQHGNRVHVRTKSNAEGRRRRPLEGRWLLRKTLAEERPPALVAFEIDHEATVLEALGPAGFRNWLFDLQTVVDQELEEGELFGRWKDRYVLATRGDAGPREVEAFARRVQAAFRGAGQETGDTGVERAVRFAMLQSTEVTACGERALDELVRKILSRGPRDTLSGGIAERLPHPLAVPHLVIPNKSTSIMRCQAFCHAIELYLKFHVALTLGWLRAQGRALPAEPLVEVLRTVDLTQRLTLGAWLSLARRLARLVPAEAAGLVPRVVTPLGARRGRGAALQNRLAEAVKLRNEIVHAAAAPTEEGYHREETQLRETFEELNRIVRELAQARLVSVKKIESVEGDDEDDPRVLTYTLREHRGPKELFPSRRETTTASLRTGWCYLLVDGEKPLGLAPLFWSGNCEQCQREELFVADELWRGALRGDPTRLRGITSNHAVKVEAPLSRRERALLDAWAAPRGGRGNGGAEGSELAGPDSLQPDETRRDDQPGIDADDGEPTRFFAANDTDD
jgi:diguanylate cyclase (GGDEF)-like protein